MFQQTDPDSISRTITASVDDVGALHLSGFHVEGPFSEQFITGAKTTCVQIPIPPFSYSDFEQVVKPLHTSVKQRCLHYLGHLVIGKIESFTKEKSSITISGLKLIQGT